MVAGKNYGLITSAAEFAERARTMIREGRPLGFDIESGYKGPDAYVPPRGIGLLPHHPDWIMVGFSFTNSRTWARYIPMRHDIGTNVDNMKGTMRVLWRLLNSVEVIAHNFPFELTGVSRTFVEMLGDDEKLGEEITEKQGFFTGLDTLIETKMIQKYDPFRVGNDLKSQAEHELDQKYEYEFKDLFPPEDTDMGPGTPKSKLKFIRFNTRNPQSPRIINYTCEDATAALELHEHYHEGIVESDQKFLFGVETELAPILTEMEFEGLAIDWASVEREAGKVEKFKGQYNEQIQQDFVARTGNPKPVLLTSPAQLAAVLYADKEDGGLGLRVTKKSEKTGVPSTDDDSLRVIAESDQIIKDILTFRQVNKLLTSYLNKYYKELNYGGTGRAYPNHNQLGAGTGRMSVDGVSYQQWPKPYHFELRDGTSYDLNFRDFLISPEGYRIIGYDYSQVELRILAGQAQETAMMEAFANDIDIHRATASTMLRIPLEEITKKQRGVGKTSNFAVVYQSGAENIADMLSAQGSPTTKEEAEKMLEQYYSAFPKLRAWMNKMVNAGSEQGYVETLFKRKFTIWEYSNPNSYIRSKGDRLAINAPIQGGAADYMKIAMVRQWKAIKRAEASGEIPKGGIRLVMTVHDALEWYVRNDIPTQQVIDLLGPAVSFQAKQLGGVVIRADWHEGLKWGHVVEVKRDKETGKITGYQIEDDDVVSDTIEEAYARYEVVDAENAKKKADKIAARLAEQEKTQAEYQAINEHLVGIEKATEAKGPAHFNVLDASEGKPAWSYPNPPEKVLAAAEKVLAEGGSASTVAKAVKMKAEAEAALGDEPVWAHARGFEGYDLLIEMSEMPTESAWEAFTVLVKTLPGTNEVSVTTPEGDLGVIGTCGLVMDEQTIRDLNHLLGPITMTMTERIDGTEVLDEKPQKKNSTRAAVLEDDDADLDAELASL